jgi:hypothetical protein
MFYDNICQGEPGGKWLKLTNGIYLITKGG